MDYPATLRQIAADIQSGRIDQANVRASIVEIADKIPERAPVPLYVALARAIGAHKRCKESGRLEWEARHAARVALLARNHLPSGSGLDLTPAVDVERSTEERIVITRADFHHMNDGGFYDGWTSHEITVRPSLAFGFQLSITGRNRNEIKDYLHETFGAALGALVEEYPGEEASQ